MGSSGYLEPYSKKVHCNDSSVEANINDKYLIRMKMGTTTVRPLNPLMVYHWHPLRLHVGTFKLNHDPAIFNNTDILHKDDQMQSILASGLSFSIMPSDAIKDELRENSIVRYGEIFSGMSDYNQKSRLTIGQWMGHGVLQILILILIIWGLRRCWKNRGMSRQISTYFHTRHALNQAIQDAIPLQEIAQTV